MKASELAAVIGDTVQKPAGTVADRIKALRSRGLLSRGVQGTAGARMTETDAISALLASLLDHGRGEDVAVNVLRLRGLPWIDAVSAPENPSPPWKTTEDHAHGVAYFTRGLSFRAARTFGQALDAFLADLRSGAFAAWTEGASAEFSADYYDDGHALICLDRPRFNRAVVYSYGAMPEQSARGISRITCIDGAVLEKIAAALGPPD